jgi:hypothetical protein
MRPEADLRHLASACPKLLRLLGRLPPERAAPSLPRRASEKPNMGLSMSSSFFRGTSFLGLGFVFGRLF